jgi:hypothetical protein
MRLQKVEMRFPGTDSALRQYPRPAAVVALILATVAFSCGRSNRADGSSENGHGGNGATSTGGASGSSGTGSSSGARAGTGATGGSEGGAGGEPDGCQQRNPPTAVLRRLTRLEYDNTVRDLFEDMTKPAQGLPDDTGQNARDVSASEVEGYHRLAHDFALRVTSDEETTNAFAGCDPLDGEAACRDSFVEDFVTLAFRRPATSDELDDFSTVFESGQTLGGDFRSGVRAVVEVALEAPEFLYRVELGEPADDIGPGWARPTSYEMASRLSYFFWSAPPDRTLLAAAEDDVLSNPPDIAAQARRLAESDRSRDMVGGFYLRLLGVRGADSFAATGSASSPSFTPEIAELLLEETRAYTSDLTLGGDGDFRALLTASFTFVNGPLADYYGISGVSGETFVRTPFDTNERAGLLTQGSFLAANSFETISDPARRGSVVANSFFCMNIPREPSTPEPTLPGQMTTREWLSAQTANASCQGCHTIVNPLGFAFEHFDQAGLYRATEKGLPIDATGEVSDVGAFNGPGELAEHIVASDAAGRCFVENWFRFAVDRAVMDDDACSLESLHRAFASERGNLRELLVALTQTDAFLYRPAVTP